MKCSPWTWSAVIALMGLSGAGTTARGDDPPAKADDKQTQETKVETKRGLKVIAIAGAGKHWIGIHATPVNDEALKSQLDLKGDKLIVVQIVPESPSAKAGVKQHDILLKFGEQELTKLEDLMKAVNENGDKPAKILVLRGGKNETLTIQPTERPADARMIAIREVLPQDLRVWVEGSGKDGDESGKFNWRIIGPGIATAKAFAHGHGAVAFPNGLSLSVSKDNDQPAKIVAKKDGKTYETTEDKLSELPAEIRSHVERLLHGPHTMAFSLSDMKSLPVEGAKIQLEVQKAVESAKKQAEEIRAHNEGEAKAIRNRIEVRRTEGGPIDELRKEIDSLRKDLQKLKDGKAADGKGDSDKN